MYLEPNSSQIHPAYVASQPASSHPPTNSQAPQQPQQPLSLQPPPQDQPDSGKGGSVAPGSSSLLSPPTSSSSMERSAPEYSQSGLPSPYPSNFGDSQSEASSADHASAAPYGTQQEVRSTTYSTSATPTSDYSLYPQSARSSSFPEHVQRSYHPASSHAGGSGGMAQTPTSPLPDGRNHQTQVKSDSGVPIDPSITAPSPTYPHANYPPYAAPPQDMSHSYQHAGSASLYAQPRPDWAGYGPTAAPITPSHHVFSQTPTSAAPPSRPSQVGRKLSCLNCIQNLEGRTISAISWLRLLVRDNRSKTIFRQTSKARGAGPLNGGLSSNGFPMDSLTFLPL